MTPIRLAMALIWAAYGALAASVALFAVTIRWIRPDIGTVLTATVLLGIIGTAGGIALLSGSALGTYALTKHETPRKTIAVATVLAGWLGGSVVGWIVWSFWTHS